MKSSLFIVLVSWFIAGEFAAWFQGHSQSLRFWFKRPTTASSGIMICSYIHSLSFVFQKNESDDITHFLNPLSGRWIASHDMWDAKLCCPRGMHPFLLAQSVMFYCFLNSLVFWITALISLVSQVINNKGYDGAKADIWSCGVILFVLMAGFLPFEEPNLVALYKKVYVIFHGGQYGVMFGARNIGMNATCYLDNVCWFCIFRYSRRISSALDGFQKVYRN